MNAKELILNRRSIRKFKDQVVDNNILKEIVNLSRYSPSWSNYQIVRYHFISDPNIINKINEHGVKGFIYNKNTLKNAKNILVLSYIQGKSGSLDKENLKQDYTDNTWEMFDSGIACQTFCLSAYEYGIGTCIFGVIDTKKIAEIINLPKEEKISSLIVLGYPQVNPDPTPRHQVDKLVKFY